MIFNPNKTVSMSFYNRNIPTGLPGLFIGGTEIAEVQEHCHLGLTLSCNMSWSGHINTLLQKANSRLGVLQSLKYHLSRPVLIKLYNTLILPLFDYGDLLYDNSTTTQLNLLVAVHIRAGQGQAREDGDDQKDRSNARARTSDNSRGLRRATSTSLSRMLTDGSGWMDE